MCATPVHTSGGRASLDFGVLTTSAQDTVVCCTVTGSLASCDTIALSFDCTIPTRSSVEGPGYCAKASECLYPRITSRKTRKRLPCSGLVKKSPIICSVGQCRIVIPASLVRSLIQKYRMSMCRDLGPADALPFVSSLMALSLSCSKTFSTMSYPYSLRKFATHKMLGR